MSSSPIKYYALHSPVSVSRISVSVGAVERVRVGVDDPEGGGAIGPGRLDAAAHQVNVGRGI